MSTKGVSFSVISLPPQKNKKRLIMDENKLKRIKVDKIYQTTTTLDTTKHQNDRDRH